MEMTNAKFAEIIDRINDAVLLPEDERIKLGEELRSTVNQLNVVESSNSWWYATAIKHNLREKLGVVVRATHVVFNELHIPAWLRTEIASMRRGENPSLTYNIFMSQSRSGIAA